MIGNKKYIEQAPGAASWLHDFRRPPGPRLAHGPRNVLIQPHKSGSLVSAIGRCSRCALCTARCQLPAARQTSIPPLLELSAVAALPSPVVLTLFMGISRGSTISDGRIPLVPFLLHLLRSATSIRTATAIRAVTPRVGATTTVFGVP